MMHTYSVDDESLIIIYKNAKLEFFKPLESGESSILIIFSRSPRLV